MDLIAIRASSLPELFDCPARWASKHVDGKFCPKSPQAHIGTSLHASTAVFDGAALRGEALTAGDTEGIFIDTLYHPEEAVDWSLLDIAMPTVEQIGRRLHRNYCEKIAPSQTYVGVEVQCKSLEVEFPDHKVTLKLTGSTDRVRLTTEGKRGIADLKSGKTAVSKAGKVDVAKHGAQLAVYELLVEQETGLRMDAPAQVIGLATVGEARVGIGELQSPRDVLIGTQDEPGLLDAAVRMVKGGIFYGNPRSMLCSEKFCPIYDQCKWKF